MSARRITHVEGGGDYSKVHRLLVPTNTLIGTHGDKLACGRTFRLRAQCAGYHNFPEDHSGMCQQCRAAVS